VIDRRFMGPRGKQRPQAEANRSVARHEAVGDVDRVLEARQEQALLDDEPLDGEPPHRETAFEPELFELIDPLEEQRAAHALFAAQPMHSPTGQTQPLAKLADHDEATERRRQGRGQQRMVAAGHHAANRA
jgi:hypothetical protein